MAGRTELTRLQIFSVLQEEADRCNLEGRKEIRWMSTSDIVQAIKDFKIHDEKRKHARKWKTVPERSKVYMLIKMMDNVEIKIGGSWYRLKKVKK